MIRAAIVLILGASLAAASVCPAAASLSPAGAAAKRSCARKHSHVIAQNRVARAYEAPGETPGGSGKLLYGCLKSTGRSVKLAEKYDDQYVLSGSYADVRLVGRYVAWSQRRTDISCKGDCPPGYDPVSTSVGVYDLKGRKARQARGASVADGALVLSVQGAGGWVQKAAGGAEVHTLDSAGEHVLDRGNIPPASLKLNGAVLSWTKDGQPRTAPLP